MLLPLSPPNMTPSKPNAAKTPFGGSARRILFCHRRQSVKRGGRALPEGSLTQNTAGGMMSRCCCSFNNSKAIFVL